MRCGYEIDREGRGAVGGDHARRQRVGLGVGQLDRQEAVLQAVLPVDVGEAARHDAADAGCEHRPHRALARGAAAEIAAGHQDAGRAELRLVENESPDPRCHRAPARAHEQELAPSRD